jgi:hypothetical protein
VKPTKKTTVSIPDSQEDMAGSHAPQKLTLVENAILTIKVLALAALILVSLWGLKQWTTSN